MLLLVASEPAPVMSFHNRLPAPEPSGGTVAETNWKQPALNVSSSGRLVMIVSPEFCTTMRKVMLLPMLMGPFVGLNKVLVIVSDACVMAIPTLLVLVVLPPAFAVAE